MSMMMKNTYLQLAWHNKWVTNVDDLLEPRARQEYCISYLQDPNIRKGKWQTITNFCNAFGWCPQNRLIPLVCHQRSLKKLTDLFYLIMPRVYSIFHLQKLSCFNNKLQFWFARACWISCRIMLLLRCCKNKGREKVKVRMSFLSVKLASLSEINAWIRISEVCDMFDFYPTFFLEWTSILRQKRGMGKIPRK